MKTFDVIRIDDNLKMVVKFYCQSGLKMKEKPIDKIKPSSPFLIIVVSDANH